jgi:hypothetical protein
MEYYQTKAEMVAEIRAQIEAAVEKVHKLEIENIAQVLRNKCDRPDGVITHARANRFLMEDIDIARRDIEELMRLLDHKLALKIP